MLFCYSFKKQMCRCLSVHVDTLWEYSYNIPSLFVRCHRCLHVCNLINTMSHQYPIQFDLQLNELLEEKVRPYIQNINSGALPRPIIIQPQNQDKKVSPSFPLLLWLYCNVTSINKLWSEVLPLQFLFCWWRGLDLCFAQNMPCMHMHSWWKDG